MRAVVVYESMYGNTHVVATAIGRGLTPIGEVDVVPVEQATAELLATADLLVVGGPTHGHSMTRESTREAAVRDAQKPDSTLTLDPDAEGEGLREWFDELGTLACAAAAFDTRFDMAATLTGRASKGIKKRLEHHGLRLLTPPESFFVQKGNTLEDGETARAETWGAQLATALTAAAPQHR